MDLLQQELARKKSVLEKVRHGQDETTTTTSSSSSNSWKKRKYIRQSDLRRIEEQMEEEQEEALRQQQQKAKTIKEEVDARTTKKAKTEASSQSSKTRDNSIDKTTSLQENPKPQLASSLKHDSKNTSTEEQQLSVALQLRSLGLPICFFGETLEERIQRLDIALAEQRKTLQGLSEMQEFRLGKGHGIRNPFLERDRASGAAVAKKESQQPHDKDEAGDVKGENGADTKNNSDKHTADDDDVDAVNDPPRRIHKFFKGLLKEWESDLENRPDTVANSVAGRNESKTLKQCKDYIRPLFKLLKQRKLEPGMQANLIRIVDFAQDGEFVKAHDAYMDVAIGRAAWPIGVTMVGIHARSGRAKIESSNVAHVMNSELQRKYLTSVKRLLSYAQKKRPDVDPSKKVT